MIIQSSHALTIGKTRITILLEGCVDCGIAQTPGAEEAVQHMIQAGDRKFRVTLKRCMDCAAARGATWAINMKRELEALRAKPQPPATKVHSTV